MKKRLTWLGVVPAIIAVLAFGPALVASQQASQQAQAAPPSPLQHIPITGTVVGGGTFQGTFDVVSFATNNGALVANGLLNGTLNTPGGSQTVTDEYVSLPASLASSAAAVPGTCNILHLTLGPLDLNLLGLEVHLNRVVLDITAHQGPGNLLGNLLCAIAHLLDQPPSPLDQIVGLLNRIIDLLG